MGYTVWYKGTSDTPLTDAERDIVAANAAEYTERLSETAEDFAWEIDATGCSLSGWTKPGLDDDMEDDVDIIIAAVRALDEALPGFQFTVTDDFDSELYP